jgi:anti-sigma factor RsiW
MKCLEREQLFAYIHGMLKPRQEAGVRAHVEVCAACQGALEEFRKLDAVLDQWKPTEPSPWFDARVRAAIAAEAQRRPSRGFFGLPWTRWLAPALLVLLVVVAVFVLRRSPKPPQQVARQQMPKPTQAAPVAIQPATVATQAQPAFRSGEEELSLYENLPVLEDYDLLANFDVLSELPKGGKHLAN